MHCDSTFKFLGSFSLGERCVLTLVHSCSFVSPRFAKPTSSPECLLYTRSSFTYISSITRHTHAAREKFGRKTSRHDSLGILLRFAPVGEPAAPQVQLTLNAGVQHSECCRREVQWSNRGVVKTMKSLQQS